MPLKQTLAAFFLLLLMGSAPALAQSDGGETAPEDAPKNVILFIADGAGPASFTMARDFLRSERGVESLALDSVLVGSIRTFSTSSRVTDSAAGATAFSAGVKTYNGAIAVDPEERPVATVLEAAERRGMATGLVATSRLTHATPAAFAAHVPNRSMEDEIAAQMLSQDIEVLMGGGRRHFLPDSVVEGPTAEQAPHTPERGRRTDGRDLMQEAEAEGYTVARTRDELMAAEQTPLLGLFEKSHMAYALDRDSSEEPSLAEMTETAIRLLSKDEDGFFLMVEASRIDHAGHDNDAAAHLADLLAYDEAAKVALDFARQNGQTLVVATSDHETGGLTLGREVDGDGVYAWKPEVLAEVKASHGPLVEAVKKHPLQADSVFRALTGIETLTESEAAMLQNAIGRENGIATVDEGEMRRAVSEIIARHAIVGWTTGGHTAVDVNVYAHGPGAERFRGNRDNTHIGRALAEIMGFDLGALTTELRAEEGAAAAAGGE